MKIAILIFGQFRSYKKNLRENLKNIKFITDNNEIDIFILTDKKGNYSENNENEIKDILKDFDIKFIKYWEDLVEFHNDEIENKKRYDNSCKHKKGKHPFTSNLWFRRYILNKLKNNYCKENNISHDLILFARLFDTSIKLIKEDKNILKPSDKLYMATDTFFLCNPKIYDNLMKFGKSFPIKHDEIWKDKNFVDENKKFDKVLTRVKHTYCSETQIFAYLFYNKFNYVNIRFDYNNRNSKDNKKTIFKILHCKDRHKIK